MTTPIMPIAAWCWQAYEYVPASAKVCVKESVGEPVGTGTDWSHVLP